MCILICYPSQLPTDGSPLNLNWIQSRLEQVSNERSMISTDNTHRQHYTSQEQGLYNNHQDVYGTLIHLVAQSHASHMFTPHTGVSVVTA